MAHSAAIAINEEVRQTFKSAKETGDIAFIEIGIDLAKHCLIFRGKGRTSGEAETDWEFIRGRCQPKNHTYFLVPSPAPAEAGKWLLVHWAPDLTPVRQRMLYASNRANLKQHIGPSDFVRDYFVSDAASVDVGVFFKARSIGIEKIDVRTEEERMKDEANIETRAQSCKSSVMSQLPINVLDAAVGVMKNFAASNIPAGSLSLNTKNQDVEGIELGTEDADTLAEMLPPDEPRYVFFRFRHERHGIPTSKNIFVYYCPDAAHRRMKFTYSTCKQNVLAASGEFGVKVDLKLEIADRADIGTAYFLRELYPVQETVQKFSKPVAPGRRRRRGKRKPMTTE